MNYETGKPDYDSVHTDYVSSKSCVYWAFLVAEGLVLNLMVVRALIHIKRLDF